MITVDRVVRPSPFHTYVYSPVVPSLHRPIPIRALVSESGAVIIGRQNDMQKLHQTVPELQQVYHLFISFAPLLLESLKIHVVLIFAGEDLMPDHSHVGACCETYPYLHTPIQRYDIFS
jgi:hypothetical protein